MSAIEEKLEGLRRKHYECDDGWYSCPLSEEGCLNDSDSGCTCGADKHNARVDELSAELAALRAHESERKTVHEWLNDLDIPIEENGKEICLLRRIRITTDKYAALRAENEKLKKTLCLDWQDKPIQLWKLFYERDNLRAENEQLKTDNKGLSDLLAEKYEIYLKNCAEIDRLTKAVEQMTKPLETGELVAVAHWSDFDTNDAVQVGKFSHFEDKHYYIMESGRGWRYCRRVLPLTAHPKEQE